MTATFSKPITLPIWADTGTITVPSGAKQSQGWLNTEKPPASFFNWYQNLNGNWMRWFNERFDDDEPSWRPNTAYVIGNLRTNVGNKYIVTVAGTSASSGGPTGTGTGIIDGTVTWNFVSVASPNVFIIKNPNDGTSQLRTITTGGIQIDTSLIIVNGMTIGTGLNVGFVGAITASTVKVGDVNFGLYHSATPFLGFDANDGVTYNRATNKLTVDIGSTNKFTVNGSGITVSSGAVTPTIPFSIDSSSTSTLGSSVGDSQIFHDISGTNSNVSTTRVYSQRLVAGSTWQTSARYFHHVTDTTYNGFLGFFGDLAVAGTSGWSGITTLGVGIGAVSHAGPPTLSPPTIFVDSSKLYISNKNFFLSRPTTAGRVTFYDPDPAFIGYNIGSVGLIPQYFHWNIGTRTEFLTASFDSVTDIAAVTLQNGPTSTGSIRLENSGTIGGSATVTIKGDAGRQVILQDLPSESLVSVHNSTRQSLYFFTPSIRRGFTSFANETVSYFRGTAAAPVRLIRFEAESDTNGGIIAMFMSSTTSFTPPTEANVAKFFCRQSTSPGPAHGEMYVMDGLGNVTILSPHDANTGELIINSFAAQSNKTVKIYLERLVAAVEELSGKKLSYVLDGNETHNCLAPPSDFTPISRRDI